MLSGIQQVERIQLLNKQENETTFTCVSLLLTCVDSNFFYYLND